MVVDILIERIPTKSIPRDPDQVSKWLNKRYEHKVIKGINEDFRSRRSLQHYF